MSHVAKIVLMGPSSVGKSALVHRLRTGEFAHTDATIGAAFASVTVTRRGDAPPTRFELWDVAGDPRYRALLPLYLARVDGVLLCCDARTSDDEREAWAREAAGCGGETIVVGTKADLGAVAGAEVQTSAKTGEGVDALLERLRACARPDPCAIAAAVPPATSRWTLACW